MNILIVTPRYQQRFGDTEKFSLRLHNYLTEKDYQASYLSFIPGLRDRDRGTKKKHFYLLGTFFWWKTFPVSLKVFLFFYVYRKFDIIHIFLPNPMAMLAYILLKPKGKLIVSWHREISTPKIFDKIYLKLTHELLERADRIILTYPNNISQGKALNSYRYKCEIVPLGINPKNYPTDFIERIRKRKESYSLPIVLYVGRFFKYKGLSETLSIWNTIPAQLILIGEGPEHKTLQSYIKKHDLEQKVKILSPRRLNINHYFALCDIFLLPSTTTKETFGLVQLEAMMYEKPVVSMNLTTAVPWVNQHRETGLICKPGNLDLLQACIRHLLVNKDKASAYGKNGKKRVLEHFSEAASFSKIVSIYQSLLKTSYSR